MLERCQVRPVGTTSTQLLRPFALTPLAFETTFTLGHSTACAHLVFPFPKPGTRRFFKDPWFLLSFKDFIYSFSERGEEREKERERNIHV